MLDILFTWNNLWWVLLVFVNFFLILGAYRLFGKRGLFVWSAISIIMANIQVVETVQLFGLVATLGNVIYGTTFLATDILDENHSKKDAHLAVWIGFYAMIAMTIVMSVCLLFTPDASDFGHNALSTVFSLMPRIALGSLTAYLLSQHHDVWAFDFWRKITKNRWLWVRNNLSTMTSQAIDTIVFCSIAFIGVFPWNIWLQIVLTTYVLKIVVAALDTPFIYWAKKIKSRVGKTALLER